HRHLRALRFRSGGEAIRRRDFAQQSNNLVLVDELGDDGCCLIRLALVVFRDDLNCSPVDSAGFVYLVGGHLDAVLGRLTETGRAAGEIAVISNHDWASRASVVAGSSAFTGKADD